MQSEREYPKINMPSVAEFVEHFATLFNLSVKQNDKITIARSYVNMQKRYDRLDGKKSSVLIEALAGISVYPTEKPSAKLQDELSCHFGHMQQLVSWIQASLVYKTPNQWMFNIALMKWFVSPQLNRLLLEVFDHLPVYSPLKQLDICIEAIIQNEYDPIKACKALLREMLDEKLQNRCATHLGFRKSLNGLDERSTKNPSTQRRELKDLDNELSPYLNPIERQKLIQEMTGVYAAMMALKRLDKLMRLWHPTCFEKFMKQLHGDMHEFDQKECSPRLQSNSKLLEELYDLAIPEKFSWPPVTNATSKAFQNLLNLCDNFYSLDEPASLQAFLRDGLTKACSKQALMEIQQQLESFTHRPYYYGVKAFLMGIMALCNLNIILAEKKFQESLNACEQWPLGPFRSQAMLFFLGIKLAKNPGQPPNSINPLLATYIASLPQEYTLVLSTEAGETIDEHNLNRLIYQYNLFCSELCDHPAELLINPLRKIENYLKTIFHNLHEAGLTETKEHLQTISFALTNKRNRERIKSDFLGVSLYNWLKANDMHEISIYFPSPKSLDAIPSICRYLELPPALQNAILIGTAGALD